ncbi:hypothetical protein AB1286_02775 [Trinickia sp. NRRL B-1857]|uniref:hypothetical protein n=1 Tax=Trinickia sp. NRRL B-1857 TaxID=3162879 RepID=UPI003D280C7A
MLKADNNGLVLTPYGHMPASDVVAVGAGEIVGVSNGRLVSKDIQSGAIVADHGAVSEDASSEDPRARAKRLCSEHLKAHGLSGDYLDVVYPGYFTSAGATRVGRFSTTWVVPEYPHEPDEKTFFLWNGADGGTLQPVLQWANGLMGYTIANWAFVGGYAVHSTFLPVEPKEVLTGVIKYVGRSASYWTFKQSFENFVEADLTVERPNDISSICQCFEATSNEPRHWPVNEYTAMSKINLVRREGVTTPASLNWQISTTTKPPVTQSGKTTVIVSNSAVDGEIDFYFH